MNSKEIANFFSGFAANQVLTHGALAVGGVEFTLFGIAYTPKAERDCAIVCGIILALLIYYSWMKK